MEFRELTEATQVLLNTIQSESSSMKANLELMMGRCKTEEELRRVLSRLLDGSLKSLAGAISELKYPVIILELEDEHPCDSCVVVRLDPGEHCGGCVNEARRGDWIPPESRDPPPYIDVDECSAEEDLSEE